MNYKDLKINTTPPSISEDFNLKVAPLALQIPTKPNTRAISSLSAVNVGAIMTELEIDPTSDLFPKPKKSEDEPIWRKYKDFSNDH